MELLNTASGLTLAPQRLILAFQGLPAVLPAQAPDQTPLSLDATLAGLAHITIVTVSKREEKHFNAAASAHELDLRFGRGREISVVGQNLLKSSRLKLRLLFDPGRRRPRFLCAV